MWLLLEATWVNDNARHSYLFLSRFYFYVLMTFCVVVVVVVVVVVHLMFILMYIPVLRKLMLLMWHLWGQCLLTRLSVLFVLVPNCNSIPVFYG